MSKNEVWGKCHICGLHTRLTFEHVPPRRAFNNRPVVYQSLQDVVGTDQENDPTEGEVRQRGVGAYTLCPKCNNDTGSWYGPSFVHWAYQGLSLVKMSKGDPILYLHFHIFPLRVIKQILCMFCSSNGSQWASPELRRFLLTKEIRHLPGDWRMYAFFNMSSQMRQTGIVARASPGGIDCFSEIAFPPFGYVMTKDKTSPDTRLQEITFFARYAYNDWKHVSLNLPLLPVATWVPGDYRTKEQVDRDVADNKRKELERLAHLEEELRRRATS